MKSLVIPVALAALLLAVPAAADTIRLADGRSIDGVRIVSESWTEVEYRKPGISAAQKVAASEVVDVQYGSTSAEYREALTKLGEGDLIGAAQYFVLAADDAETADNVRATARLRAADALNENGNLQDALKLYDQLLNEFPQTRHLGAARLGRAKTLFRTGQYDQAAQAFAELRAEAAERGYGERIAQEAEFFELWVAQAQGRTQEAADGYQALLQRVAGTDKATANRCRMRLGRLRLEQEDAKAAREMFEQIIDERLEVARDVAAEAFNGRGRVLFAQGAARLTEADKLAAAGDGTRADDLRDVAKDDFREARLDFLRVVVSYPDVKSQQAEAAYWAAQCFLNLGEPDADKDAGRLLRTAQESPGSPWAKAASEALGR